VEYQPGWVEQERQREIEAAAAGLELDQLAPVKGALPPDFTYDEIRLVVANLRRRRGDQSMAAAT
jgi:hypothetical protein